MENFYFHATPVGVLRISASSDGVTGIAFTREAGRGSEEASPVIAEAIRQLDEYFASGRTAFDLPLSPAGTDFQQKVWAALQSIPYGATRTYGQVADAVGNPGAARAVGMANNRNPIAIVIPCHRVIGANGSLTGYAGGLGIKELLLNLEKNRR